MKKLPMGAGSATLVSVKYPAELGSYTPGDTWDLYVGKDNRVEVLVFRHGGDKKPSRITTTWTGYKKAGPLLISTEHRGTADGKPLHISISDVAVKFTGSDTWVRNKAKVQKATKEIARTINIGAPTAYRRKQTRQIAF